MEQAVFDTHNHLVSEDSYADRLADVCAKLNIVRCLLMGGGKEDYNFADNDEVLAACGNYPELFIPVAYFRLGLDAAKNIAAFNAMGFHGIKFINPLSKYSDERYFEVYSEVQRLRLPAIFHTGIVGRTKNEHLFVHYGEYQRPIYLDTVDRMFPDLVMIAAHFGNPWSDELAMALRWNPNLYTDFSGSVLKYRKAQYIADLLWWKPVKTANHIR